MKKATLVTLATITLMGTSLAAAKDASAFWPFDKATEGNGVPSLIQRLIDRFDLNQDEVESVISEYKQERHQAMEQKHAELLDQAVSDGKITEEQKQELEEIHENWIAEKDTWTDLTPEERRSKAQSHRDEMQAWAEENGIDLSDIMPFGQGRGGHMKGMGRGMHGGFGATQSN